MVTAMGKIKQSETDRGVENGYFMQRGQIMLEQRPDVSLGFSEGRGSQAEGTSAKIWKQSMLKLREQQGGQVAGAKPAKERVVE